MRAIMSCQIGNDSDNHHLVSSQKCANDLTVLLNDSIHTPDGLAIDWVHDLLFWTDGGLDTVRYSTLVFEKLTFIGAIGYILQSFQRTIPDRKIRKSECTIPKTSFFIIYIKYE